jgi:spore coat protein SA
LDVLMICTEKLPVPNIRGGAIQTYICGVVRHLARHHRITIIGREDPALPEDETVDGIRYVRLDSQGLFGIYAARVVELLKREGKQYDLVHIFNRPRMVAPVREAVGGARIVLSMHNDMFGPEKIERREGAEAVTICERIITISNYVGKELCSWYPQASTKVRTIYSGVDLHSFAPWYESEEAARNRKSLREQFGLDSNKVILFVGRLSPKKGPHVLVQAMSHLNTPDAALVIVGGSWYSDNTVSDYVAYVRALAGRSPLPVVTTGYVPSEDVHRWFSAGDLFVCTSLWNEPLARVHYEAMAAGLPFLTTNRGGNSEVVLNDNGLIVDNPEDPEAFASQLNQLLPDADRRLQMGKNGRVLAESRFTWDRVAGEILDVWTGN